jgi:superfamily II DNA helicase RecQ
MEVSEKLIDEKVEGVFVLSESDKQLAEKLKLYRNEKAKEEGYDGFKYHLIFSSSTINNLVEMKPQTTAQLFEIKGLAQVKINKYGNDVLKIIREHVAKDLDLNEKIDTEDNLDKDAEIRNKLKQLRTEISKKDNIKPYVVFNNEQMEEIIKSKPKRKDQL